MVEALEGTHTVSCVDDLIVVRRSREEENQNLEMVLIRLNKLNIPLNEGKIQLAKSHVVLWCYMMLL